MPSPDVTRNELGALPSQTSHRRKLSSPALNYICNKMSAQSLRCTSEGMTEDRPAWHPCPSLLLQPTMHTKRFWWNQEYKLCLIQATVQSWLRVTFFFAKRWIKFAVAYLSHLKLQWLFMNSPFSLCLKMSGEQHMQNGFERMECCIQCDG